MRLIRIGDTLPPPGVRAGAAPYAIPGSASRQAMFNRQMVKFNTAAKLTQAR
jgi:hypothetical protein